MSSILHTIVTNGHDLAETSRARYLHDLDTWIAYAGADPAGWNNAVVQKFYTGLLRKMKPQSANRILASLRYASKWYSLQNNNPALHFAASIQIAKPRGKLDKPILDEREAKALIFACFGGLTPIDLRDRAMIVVLLETGMRRVSLASMEIEHTVIDPELARMRRSPLAPYPTTAVEIKGSNGDRVHVPLSDTACVALAPWLLWLKARVKTGPVFRGFVSTRDALTNKRLSDSGIQKILDNRAAIAKFNPPHVNPHRFRHTFITWRTVAGLTPVEIAAITHHKIPGLGALSGYMNMIEIGDKARNATPQWLRELVGG